MSPRPIKVFAILATFVAKIFAQSTTEVVAYVFSDSSCSKFVYSARAPLWFGTEERDPAQCFSTPIPAGQNQLSFYQYALSPSLVDCAQSSIRVTYWSTTCGVHASGVIVEKLTQTGLCTQVYGNLYAIVQPSAPNSCSPPLPDYKVFYFSDVACTVLYATGTGSLAARPTSGGPCITSDNANINNKVSVFSTIKNVTCSNRQVEHTVFTGSSTCGSGGIMSKEITTGQCSSLPYGTGLFPEVYAIVLGFACPNPTWNSTQPPPTTEPPMSSALQSCIDCVGGSYPQKYWYSFVEQPYLPGSSVTGMCVESSDIPCFSYWDASCWQYTSPTKKNVYENLTTCYPSQALLSCTSCAKKYSTTKNSTAYWHYDYSSSPFARYASETLGSCVRSLEDVPCGNYYVNASECSGWTFSPNNRGPKLNQKAYSSCRRDISAAPSLDSICALVLTFLLILLFHKPY